ncbi:MAG: hypothetical protein HY563_05075 [Ignavibacteriales bacterium]|nr:hypothetical protein [Ignavibacteriales bacterium]
MNRQILFLAVLATLLTRPVLAGGPVYTRFGVGDLLFFGSNRVQGMGISGYALTGDGFINLANPAALAKLSLTRFAGGFEYWSSSLEDNAGSQRFATGRFQSLAMGIPVADSAGISLVVSATPYSTVDYDVRIVSATGGAQAEQTLTGTGGLSTLTIGGSFRPSRDLAVGLQYVYYYGTIHRRLAVDFDDVAFADTEVRTAAFHKGSGFTLGMTYTGLGSLLGNPSLPLTLGIVFTTPASLSVKEERLLLTENTADTTQVRRGTTRLPAGWGLGITYDASHIIVSGDIGVQHWTSANFFEPPSVEVRNNLKAGVGIEIPGKRNPVTYWDRVAYRAGFAYTASYLAINGRGIDSWAVSGGIALPIGPDARMSVGLTAGKRGTMNLGLSQETFFKLSLSIDASEAWFITIEED